MSRRSIAHWTIERGGRATCADRDTPALSAATPAQLWHDIAAASADRLIHLLEADMSPTPVSLSIAAQRLDSSALDAIIRRIRYADNKLSRHVTRIETTKFFNTPPGTLLVRSEALARAAQSFDDPIWDDFWTFDLIAALCSGGFVEGSPEEFARTPKTMGSQPSDRMPFARASPHSASLDDDSPILVYGRLEASVSLYFDGLPADIGRRLRFLQPGDLSSDLPWLASAGLVIVVRDFEHMLTNGTLDLLTEIGVPYVWFIDDDFMALHREEASFSFYSKDRVQSFLSRASGIVTTTRALADAHIGLHETVLLWPCVYDRSLARGTCSPTANHFRIGVFGGGFRQQSLLDHAMPAITALGTQIPTAVFAADEIARGSAAAGIVPIAFESEFRPFVFEWRQLGLHALVHPYGVTGNIANKSLSSILVAAYLGAVPIVGDESAYAGVAEACGVLKAGRSPASWEKCLRRIADPAEALDLFGRLDGWCRETFDPENARVPFEALARLAAPGGADRAAMQRQQACQSEALRRVLNTPAKTRPTMIGRLVQNVRQRWRRGVG